MKDNHMADVSHTDEFDRMYQELVKQAEDKYKVKSEHPKTEEEIGLVDNLSSRWVNEFELPNGYIFKDENGNIINATKIVLEKKKKEYPKTYEECCKILGFLNVDLCFNADYRNFDASKEQWKRLGLMNQFYQLLICRDAYWKIAGEEMGLGKPWEPDWTYNGATKYCIGVSENEIQSFNSGVAQYIFAFPTEEMRDAFKENFDEDLEFCKELL